MEIKENLRITLVQVDLVWENPVQNRMILEEQIGQLAGKSDLAILPETFTTGFSMRACDLAEPMDGPTINWLINLSHTTGIAICGSLIIEDSGLYHNRFVFVTPTGEISCYNKRHLFSIGGESISFTSGDQRMIVNYLGWRIAMYVCYDLRFPVWCRNLNDTDLMIFTANWPASRMQVWNILLKARAIENQVYVAGVNRIGTDGNGILYSGESQMVNSRGDVLTENVLTSKGFPSYEISKSALIDFREKFPVSNDADRFVII
jgi:predicted amidohydrolase